MKNLRLYQNIRKYRKQLNMSQEELAHKVGYSGRSSISMVEKGEVDISDSMVSKFAEALGVSIYELRGDSEEYWQYIENQYNEDKSLQLSDLDIFLKLSPEHIDLFVECKKVKKEHIEQVIAILKTFE